MVDDRRGRGARKSGSNVFPLEPMFDKSAVARLLRLALALAASPALEGATPFVRDGEGATCDLALSRWATFVWDVG